MQSKVATSSKILLLVFTYHVIKSKNRNHSLNKVTNEMYGDAMFVPLGGAQRWPP